VKYRVLNTIKSHGLIEGGEGVVVGISGGPDSVCLLHVLHSLSLQLNLKLYAVHINHMLRGKEADEDENYVKGLCTKLGIPLFSESFDVARISKEKGVSTEEVGREIRYKFFYRIASEVGASIIAVAHNKNDQAETVLMNIIRGSGLDGLKGIEYKRDMVIRPLLDIERKDIEYYCTQHNLKPRLDSSNLESVYTRNKVRLDLIPRIESLFEVNITSSICKMSALIKDDIDFITNAALEHYEGCLRSAGKEEIRLDLAMLKRYHAAMQKRVVRQAVKSLKGDLRGIESIHVQHTVDLLQDGKTGAEIHLPDGIRVGISYGDFRVFFASSEKVADFDETISIPGKTYISQLKASLESFIENYASVVEHCSNIRYNSLVQFFDYEKLKKGINIRNRRDGDIFKPYKSNGTKKLKEYFIDNKIPRDERNTIPLVAIGKEVVWVVGYKISDKFKVTENTKVVLKLEYRQTNS
jgi:tRNA(Ile)-lysidine synthase